METCGSVGHVPLGAGTRYAEPAGTLARQKRTRVALNAANIRCISLEKWLLTWHSVLITSVSRFVTLCVYLGGLGIGAESLF